MGLDSAPGRVAGVWRPTTRSAQASLPGGPAPTDRRPDLCGWAGKSQDDSTGATSAPGAADDRDGSRPGRRLRRAVRRRRRPNRGYAPERRLSAGWLGRPASCLGGAGSRPIEGPPRAAGAADVGRRAAHPYMVSDGHSRPEQTRQAEKRRLARGQVVDTSGRTRQPVARTEGGRARENHIPTPRLDGREAANRGALAPQQTAVRFRCRRRPSCAGERMLAPQGMGLLRLSCGAAL